MEQRWQDTDKIINKLKSHQIGKTPEQIAQELQNHRLHMENLNRRKADKVFRDMEKQQRKTKIQDMRTTLRQMEQVVIKQQSMMDCSSAILQRQVELLQFTIAEVGLWTLSTQL
jgi:pyruvate/oxaloacetate carboxyltransferase